MVNFLFVKRRENLKFVFSSSLIHYNWTSANTHLFFSLDMSLDHVAILTFDYHKAVSFYETVLATLGYKRLITIEGDKAVGFGSRFPSFWIGPAKSTIDKNSPQVGSHIAFVAKSRRQVDEFYQVALKNGAKDNGPPGVRPQYHRFYYGAFVIDADGNNVEAVNHFDWRVYIGWKTMISPFLLVLVGVIMKKFF
ncbi:hypothetical protein I4U23_023654 [Adineta vaga]|nr:hypothetical protein I4U23_023654 [Adineta vaga]